MYLVIMTRMGFYLVVAYTFPILIFSQATVIETAGLRQVRPLQDHPQTYEFLNQTLGSRKDTVYILSHFQPLETELITGCLTESFIRQEWEPIKTKNLPDLEIFLKSFDFGQARKKAEKNNALDNTIRFDKLDNGIIPVTDPKSHLKNQKNYLALTRPVFNEEGDWAIFYKYPVFYTEIGSGGTLKIYRKLNGTWIFYWQITLWIS